MEKAKEEMTRYFCFEALLNKVLERSSCRLYISLPFRYVLVMTGWRLITWTPHLTKLEVPFLNSQVNVLSGPRCCSTLSVLFLRHTGEVGTSRPRLNGASDPLAIHWLSLLPHLHDQSAIFTEFTAITMMNTVFNDALDMHEIILQQ
jgi:hypothetical protein